MSRGVSGNPYVMALPTGCVCCHPKPDDRRREPVIVGSAAHLLNQWLRCDPLDYLLVRCTRVCEENWLDNRLSRWDPSGSGEGPIRAFEKLSIYKILHKFYFTSLKTVRGVMF